MRGEILLSGYVVQPLSNLKNNDYINNRYILVRKVDFKIETLMNILL